MRLFFIKLRNAVEFAVTTILFMVLRAVAAKPLPRTLLIIRLDAIGDYILFRNFLEVIRNSEKYKNYKITLCGNSLWKEIAEIFDSAYIDDFIWLDRGKFKSGILYKYKFLKNIKLRGFETVVDMTFTREILFGDTIVKATNAPVKIGSEGSPEGYAAWKRKLFSDDFYTQLIPSEKENVFEFYRTRNFTEHLLESPVNLKTTSIDISGVTGNVPQGDFAVIFPGAGNEKRRWSASKFAEAAKVLTDNYKLNVIICGAVTDKILAEHIISKTVNNVEDYTGRTSLSQLAKLLAAAKLLVSNDTSAIHFAAAVKTPFICISNGNHLGRFHPYPHDIFDKGYYIYPDEISQNLDNPEYLEKFRFGSDLDINLIPVEKVKEAIKKVL